MILTLHAKNTANITSVANIKTFSKEANFITALRFLTPERPYLIPHEGHTGLVTGTPNSTKGEILARFLRNTKMECPEDDREVGPAACHGRVQL